MKKFYKSSCLIMTMGLAVLLTACHAQNSQSVAASNSQASLIEKTEANQSASFVNQTTIQSLLNTIYPDSAAKDVFVNIQKRILKNNLQELKTALTWFNPFRVNTNANAGSVRRLTTQSQQIIVQNLQNNWLWLLENSPFFVFTFNPYGDTYQSERGNDQQAFEALQTNGLPVNLKVASNQITTVIPVALQAVANPKNVYQNLTAYYLFYNDQQFTKFYYYQDPIANTVGFVWQPDLLVTSLPVVTDAQKTAFATTLETALQAAWTKVINDDITYQQRINGEGAYDVQRTYQRFNDAQFLTSLSPNSYNLFWFLGLKSFHEQNPNNQVWRYTWRYIDAF